MGNIQIINWDNYKTKAEWLEARKRISGDNRIETKIGASEIGTITGVNKWKSIRRLTLEKAGLYSKDFISDSTVMGHVMEPVIAQWWEAYDSDNYELTQRNVQDGNKQRKLKPAEFFLVNDKCDHLFISLDFVPEEAYYSPLSGRLVEELTPHECKFISNDVYKSWGESGISVPYYQQMMLQIHMTEKDFGLFLPLQHMGTKYSNIFNPIEIEYDKEYAEYLVEEAGNFCINVTKIKILKEKVALSTDSSERTDLEYQIEDLIPFDNNSDVVEVTNELHKPNGEGSKKEIGDDSEELKLIKDYINWRDNKETCESTLNNLQAQLIKASDNFEGFEHPEYSVTIRGYNSNKGKYFRVNKKK